MTNQSRGGPRGRPGSDGDGLILRAAAYQATCPACGARRLLSQLTPTLECNCGAVIDLTAPRHNFGGGEEIPSGTPVVASYRWQCPECGKEHFEYRARREVRCARCGARFHVAALEHAQPRLF